MWTNLFALLIIAKSSGQAILESPRNATARPGEDVLFHCKAETKNGALLWKRFVDVDQLEETISISYPGASPEPKDADKFELVNENDLLVKNVGIHDSGIYICQLLPSTTDAKASLLIIEDPVVIAPLEVTQGEMMEYECDARFGSPQLDMFGLRRVPRLRVSLCGVDQGEGNKTLTQGTPGHVPWRIEQKYSVRISNDSSITHENVTCEVLVPDNSSFVLSHESSTIITVLPYNLTISPQAEAYFVGDFITCTALGNPVPQIKWIPKLTNGARIVSGPRLDMTETMLGNNEWACQATNTIKGNPQTAAMDISFQISVPTGPPPLPTRAASGNSGTITIVVVVVVVCVVIIALVIGFLVYKKRQSKTVYSAGEEERRVEKHNQMSNGNRYDEALTDSEIEDEADIKQEGSFKIAKNKVLFEAPPVAMRMDSKPKVAPRQTKPKSTEL